MLAALALLPLVAAIPSSREEDRAGLELFENRIRPVLVEVCIDCHGPDEQRSELRLDSSVGIRRGGLRGRLVGVESEDESGSLLLHALTYADPELSMPPRGRLPDEVLDDFRSWLERGAPLPDEPEPEAHREAEVFDLAARKAEAWALQPLRDPAPPTVRDQAWSRGDIDRFVLAGLEAADLSPASDADRRAWIRRLSYDLTGLPPEREAVEAYVADQGEGADERVVDALLASPHFAERWGRHWLDLMRYAETRGHEFDYHIPNIWRYRDYVIRAFDADVSYDRLVREHIAGDLLETPRPSAAGWNEAPLGTGYWWMYDEMHSPVDIRKDQTDRVANQVEVFSKAFLGLTVACARCHDHKFDPISTRDYYSLAGFCVSSRFRQARFETEQHNAEVLDELTRLEQQQQPAIHDELASELLPHLGGLEALVDAALELGRDPALDQPATSRVFGPLPAGLAELADTDRAALARAVGRRRAIARRAQERSLDSEALRAWVEALDEAREQAQHPLRGLVVPPGGEHEAGEVRTVVDYADPSQPWITDGPGFGLRPRAAGELILSGDAEAPVEEVLAFTAAREDTSWRSLRAIESAGYPGRLSYEQAGRTLHTQSFELESGRLWYLVRGKGHVYAAVDSHRLLHGPLHGVIVKHLDTAGEWRWIEHPLMRYAGHRLHLEVTPDKDGPALCFARVVESDSRPALPRSGFEAAEEGRETAARFARHIGDSLRQRGAASRELAFLLENPALAITTPSQPSSHVAAARYAAQADLLRARIRTDSRLAPVALDGTSVDEYLLVRGSTKSPAEPVARQHLVALVGEAPLASTGSGRLELARQVTDPELTPLFPRVWVNRLWHHLFGRGIVSTVDDFGDMGEEPTHPELLDHLASRLVQLDFSTKALLRELCLSRTYRMSSRRTQRGDEADPRNERLHRARVRRLDAESLRDTLLAASGELDRTRFGRPVPVHLTAFMQGRGRPGQSGPVDGARRRSLYLEVRRNFPVPFLTTFDFPAPATTMGARTVANVPAQALTLLNDEFVHGRADAWARRELEAGGTDVERLARMYMTLFARAPLTSERDAALAFVRLRISEGAAAPAAWKDLAHVLFNSKELLFRR